MILLVGCSPIVPSNYLGPSTIQSSEKIYGHWIKPNFIPINPEMLTSSVGKNLLVRYLRPRPYCIGSFDSLSIIVWGHPDISTAGSIQLPSDAAVTLSSSPQASGISSILSRSSASLANTGSVSTSGGVDVQTDGTIFYPYVGKLKVAGLTMEQAQIKIAQRLSRYIRNPQVTVQVAKYRNRNIYVLGEVVSPGIQPLTNKPLTLMEAISNAGGINTNTADPTHIYLIRGTYQQPDIFWLKAATPQSLMIAEHFPLEENDIVYVSAATLAGVNNFFNQILPPFSTYITIKALANRAIGK